MRNNPTAPPLKPVDASSHEKSAREFKEVYQKTHIPPEKKPYFTDLYHSHGPWLAVNNHHAILDASSQIASLGGGFNTLSGWGSLHHQEAWSLNGNTEQFQTVRRAFEELVIHNSGQKDARVFLCNSGAEANEIALGRCYQKRTSPSQSKILAFKGSFHGRMMAALAATWNPVKREPFEWPGYGCEFLEYPVVPGSDVINQKASRGWLELWEGPMTKNYATRLKTLKKSKDKLLHTEIQILDQVKKLLARKKIFAVIIEPMQCEGGDRFSSGRFHSGLLNLCRAYGVPLVYDEVQTGFGLGGEFFWHRLFRLKDSRGESIYPDYVVCAKKAQTGFVLSRDVIPYRESFSPLSVIRGYYQAMNMDQNMARILKLEGHVRPLVKNLVKKFREHVHSPRIKGLSFAFDVYDKKALARFVGGRFVHGLLFYPAGDATARFRLNLGFKESDIDFLFKSLTGLLRQTFTDSPAPKPRDPALVLPDVMHANWQTQLCFLTHRAGQKTIRGSLNDHLQKFYRELIKDYVPLPGGRPELRLITSQNFGSLKQSIKKLQSMVYEPSRVTSLQVISDVLKAPHHIALGLFDGGKLVGTTFAGSINCFPTERGVLRDPCFSDEKTLYMVDVTLHPRVRGYGYGRLLKYALTESAFVMGMNRIHGRNRDVMAAAMTAINHSLGSYTHERIKGDYPDDLGHNDCFYYQAPLGWKLPEINLSGGIESHLGGTLPSKSFRKKYAPALVNKICLSNFVSRSFIQNVEAFLQKIPASLRFAYTASGQSEVVDKIIKVLWQKRKPHTGLITFEGCFFGDGGFMSRSLSGTGQEYFKVERLEFPTQKNYRKLLKTLAGNLAKKKHLGVWAEPLTQLELKRMPVEFLRELKKICTRTGVPLIYNDTASLFYRYSKGAFSASGNSGIRPHAAFAWLGGQMAVAYMEKQFWIDTPLMLISTWDGDEYSLAAFTEACHKARDYQPVITEFQKNLKKMLGQFYLQSKNIHQGTGTFEGLLPVNAQKYFKKDSHRNKYLVIPSISEMKRFNKQYARK